MGCTQAKLILSSFVVKAYECPQFLQTGVYKKFPCMCKWWDPAGSYVVLSWTTTDVHILRAQWVFYIIKKILKKFCKIKSARFHEKKQTLICTLSQVVCCQKQHNTHCLFQHVNTNHCLHLKSSPPGHSHTVQAQSKCTVPPNIWTDWNEWLKVQAASVSMDSTVTSRQK